MEVDHKIPKALGGRDEYKNLQLLHRHCHDEKTATDLIEIRKKQHSININQLAQQWDKYEWEWVNDTPTLSLGFSRLIALMNYFHGAVPIPLQMQDFLFYAL